MIRLCFTVALACVATISGAQSIRTDSQSRFLADSSQPVRVLTMEEAVEVGLRNNPDFLQAVNNRRTAGAAQRAAFGSLLPELTAQLGGQYQSGGRQVISGVELGANSDVLQSSYNFGLSYTLNKATFVTPRLQRANRQAVEADITGASESLRTTIQQQYLNVLQSEARLELQDTLIENARSQLELAKGRAEVGAGTQLDVQRAQVALGQQEVQRLQAENQLQIDKLRLFQQMGIFQETDVRFVNSYTLDNILPPLQELLTIARSQNPGMNSLRSREQVASLNLSRTKGEYFPTLSLSTGIGGYTYQYRDSDYPVNQARSQLESARESCLRLEEVRQNAGLSNTYDQCNLITFTPQQARDIRAANNRFPFNFTSAPRSFSAQIILPLFDGFSREQRVQEATVARDNARYSIRSHELALTADITAAYLTLQAAQQTVRLQEANASNARQELEFTQEQYSVGLATFVDLVTSRATFAQAESDRINAIYDYHKAFSALENAVGRRLK